MESQNIEEDIDGCIHSIHVRNFFCHENLEVNLNKNVNFIVGRNGSGKSAILTALVVGLGGRASATNRGSNLHSFIKKGYNSATIEIKIKNSSPKAFKHHIYGDYITIVRNINASGGSNYKIKSSSGEIISTKYEEVNAIILAHDIQVDNPISVLNQDDARSFHASDAKKKYSLFRKATNLDQTEANYGRALENCNRASAIWNKKVDSCAELEKEYKKWKTSLDQFISRDEIENKHKALQNEFYWSEVAKLEKEAHSIQHQYNKQQAKMEKLEEKLKNMDKTSGSNSDAIKALKEQLKERGSEKSTAEAELRQLEEAAREAQAQWRAAHAAAVKRRDQVAREDRKLKDLEAEIQNIQSGNAGEQRMALEARAAAASRAAAAVSARYDTAQHEAAQARANLAHAQERLEQATTRAQRKRDALRQLNQQLRELQSRGNESLAVYGSHMVELCQRVKACKTFSAPPRGPVGAYLKLKERQWGGALEHIIGGSMKAFCVNTAEDSRKLFQLMGQVYGSAPKPAVTCSRFLDRVHDVRRYKVRAGQHGSALDALQVADPVVANFLIDNVRLESILLVPDDDEAIRLSSEEQNVPANCSRIVTLNCTDYYPAPNYRSYGGDGRRSRYLQVSTGERKRQVEAEIAEAQASLQQLEAAAEQCAQEAREAHDAERAASRALQALLADRHRKTEEAKAAAAALEHHQTPQQTVLLEELNVSKEKLSSLQESMAEMQRLEAEHRARADELEARVRSVKGQLRDAAAAYRSLSDEIEQEQMKLDQGVSERRACEHRVNEDRVKLAQVEGILEDKREVIQGKISEALQLCPRIEDPRDMSVVQEELKKTQLKLSAVRSDGLSKAEVAERLLAVEHKYRRTKQALDRLKVLIDDIQRTTAKHLKMCNRVQTNIARRVQFCFQTILCQRGFSGSMEIDNARGVLEILCTGRESSAKRHAATTSSLSGGERSYSTVAFIMALWECVELPFYFMDEFDVFMDNVNRKVVMDLLIDHALKNTSRQFVFLTPQDASAVIAGPRISLHLMADPRP